MASDDSNNWEPQVEYGFNFLFAWIGKDFYSVTVINLTKMMMMIASNQNDKQSEPSLSSLQSPSTCTVLWRLPPSRYLLWVCKHFPAMTLHVLYFDLYSLISDKPEIQLTLGHGVNGSDIRLCYHLSWMSQKIINSLSIEYKNCHFHYHKNNWK